MAILFLIGPRGCGKTAAAALLKRDYHCCTCDTDVLIQERSGKTVAEIVKQEGWSAFRSLEKKILSEAVGHMGEITDAPVVIATGGGIVLDPDNREQMRRHGVVAYLAAPVVVLAGRLKLSASDPSRPSLTGLPQEQEIVEILKERDPLYRMTAHHIIDAAMPPTQVAHMLYSLANGALDGGIV